jgi:hypothetical protein
MKTFQPVVGSAELTPWEGMNFRLRHRYIQIEAQSGFRSIDLAQLDGVLLALDWVVRDTHHIWGSAVMVAPGVALTAGHTVDAMRQEGFLRAGGGYLLALGFSDHGMVVWNPNSFISIGDGDLAILTLLLRSTAQPAVSIATLAARQPLVGEIVSLIGFAASETKFENLTRDRGAVIDLLGSVGPVANLYPQGRDRQTLPNPAAGVSAKTVGGMSGGAAFDARGCLIGIITSGIDETSSFISMSWPCVFTPMKSRGRQRRDRRADKLARPRPAGLLPDRAYRGASLSRRRERRTLRRLVLLVSLGYC